MNIKTWLKLLSNPVKCKKCKKKTAFWICKQTKTSKNRILVLECENCGAWLDFEEIDTEKSGSERIADQLSGINFIN